MRSPNTTGGNEVAAVMAPISNSSKRLPFEPASICRLVRAFLGCDTDASDDLPDVEAAGMLLWDLSADNDAAAGLLELHLLPAITAQLDAFLNGKLPGQSATADLQDPSTQDPAAADLQLPRSPATAAANQDTHASTSPAHAAAAGGNALLSTNPKPAAEASGDTQGPNQGSSKLHPAPERIVEICCGILANLYSTPAVVPMLVSCTDLTESFKALMLGLTDPLVLSELCRLFTAALSCPEGVLVWLPVLLSPEAIAWLLHVVSNTLHPQLLERSLLLLAALLATTQDVLAAPAGAIATAHTAAAPAGASVTAGTTAAAAAAAGQSATAAVPLLATTQDLPAASADASATAHTAAAAAAAGQNATIVPSPAKAARSAETAEPAVEASGTQQPHPVQQQLQAQPQQQTGTTTSSPAASSLDITQLLLQQGFLQALQAVLGPAAAPGARHHQQVLLQARSQQQINTLQSPGGWSEEEEDQEQEAGSPSVSGLVGGTMQQQQQQDNPRLYQHTEVLLALVTCLQQLGQDEGVVGMVLEQLPALPELLLQLMLAGRIRDQQDVLELLLPVLVMFRQGVSPLLQAPDWQNSSPTASEQDEQVTWQYGAFMSRPQGMQQRLHKDQAEQVMDAHVEDKAVICMCYWVCMAGVLYDCGPDSLDAIDAAWYLLNVMNGAERLLRLFLQSSRSSDGVSPVWVTQQLQQLNHYIDGCRSVESCHVNANRASRALCSATSWVEDDLLQAAQEAAGYPEYADA